jgi:cystathionine beta-synthase
MMHRSLLSAIGNTPLVKIPCDSAGTVYAKLEYLNPSGSVKDRPALFMIEHAEKTGILKPGGTIVDASSGNHGISLAMIGAAKGYKVIITVSEKISQEKLQAIKAYGAQVVMCPSTEFMNDPRGYHSQAVAIHQNTPNSFMPNQYFNPINAVAHYSLLGPEIWHQTDGTITHCVAAAGSTGTISGIGKFLKEKNSDVKIIAIDAATSYRSTKGNPKPYKIEGMGVDFDTPVLDHAAIDEFFLVEDTPALDMLKAMAHQYGLLIGPASGAVAYGGLTRAKELNASDVMVMIFGDSGRAYLTKNFY